MMKRLSLEALRKFNLGIPTTTHHHTVDPINIRNIFKRISGE